MAESKLQIIINAIDNASKQFKTVANNFESAGKKMRNTGKGMSLAITAPLVLIGRSAIKSSAEFDTLMRAAAQMNKGTGQSLDEMKKNIRSLAIDTVQDVNLVAQGFYDVGSAGFKGAEGIEIMRISGMAATGGLAGINDVTSTLVKTLSIFNKRGEDAGEVMDKLNGIVDTGIITFSQLASVFPKAASSAGALGASIEEVGASLAVVTKKTGSAEEAATAVDAAFRGLIKPSEDLKKMLKAIGYETGQDAIAALGFTGVLKALNEKVGGNVETLGKMFNNARALKSLIPLLSEDTREYDSALETIIDSQGRTNELFDDMVKGPGARMKKTWLELKDALISFGDIAAPVVADFAEKIGKLIEEFKKLTPEQKKTILKIAALAAAIGPLLIVLGAMASGIGVIITVLGFILSPIGLVIGSIAALVFTIVTLLKIFDQMTGKITRLAKDFGILKRAAGNAVKDLSRDIGIVKRALGFKDSVDTAKESFSKIQEEGESSALGVSRAYSWSGQTIFDTMGGIEEKTTNVFSAIGDAAGVFTDEFGNKYSAAAEIVNKKTTEMDYDFSQLSEGLSETGSTAEKVSDAFGKYFEKIKDFGRDTGDVIEDITKKIDKLQKNLYNLTRDYTKDQVGFRRQYAQEYLDQEQRVADAQADFNTATTADAKAKALERLQTEQEAFAQFASYEQTYQAEIEYLRAEAQKSEFQRNIESIKLAERKFERTYREAKKAMLNEIVLEEEKLAEIRKIQAIALQEHDRFLALQELHTVDSINIQIRKYNELARAIARAAAGRTSSLIGQATGTIERAMGTFGDFISRPGMNPVAFSPQDTIIGVKNPAALGAGGIVVNINGGTYLSEEVAEDIGDTIIDKLKSQIRI